MAGRRSHPAGGRSIGRRALASISTSLVLLIAAAAPAASAQAAGGGPGALRGVNVAGLFDGANVAQADRDIAGVRALHVSVVRAEVRWSTLEPLRSGAVDPSALAFLDRLVADAAAAGIRPILTVDSTPCWASSAPADELNRCVPGRLNDANAWPPRDAADYAAAVSYLASRYGTRLAAIEIWNEPDQANQFYFAGPMKTQRYAAILRAAYPAIKQADPSLPVLAGSLVGSNGRFLRALYAAGIKGYYDGLAVHFYNLVLGSIRSIHEVQLANGDGAPLWLDEFGWSSCFPHQRVQQEQACVTRATQARNLADVVRLLSLAPYVAAEVVYKLQDSRNESFGVLAGSGARKPAFGAFAGAIARPLGPVSRVTLSLRARRGRVVASGSAPTGDYMQLEAFKGSALRYRALFVLDRSDRYSLRLPAVIGTRGLRVRVFQYWAGRGRAAVRAI